MSDNALVLLNPGPACTSERVRHALERGDMCHRESEFTEVLWSIRNALPMSLNVPNHEAILTTGSGTSAMEMAVISSVREGKEMLVVNNGVYGERLKKIATAHKIPVTEVAGDWFTPISVEGVAAALRANPNIDAVAAVHHETTTGMINPIKAIGEIASAAGVLLVIDAISSTGIEDQDLGEVAADIICGTANKGLHGLPGIAFILVSTKAVERLYEVPVRSLYLNAATYLDGQRQGDVPFTPAVQVCFAFDEAIKEFIDAGGFATRTRLYRERAAFVRKGFEKLGLQMPVAEEHRSNAVSLLGLPIGVSYPQLHGELRRRGYVIYAGQGKLAAGYFRICTMGEISFETLEQLLVDLEETIATLQG
jgi:2-aminoethylphosphonate-pyruvate transaminase